MSIYLFRARCPLLVFLFKWLVISNTDIPSSAQGSHSIHPRTQHEQGEDHTAQRKRHHRRNTSPCSTDWPSRRRNRGWLSLQLHQRIAILHGDLTAEMQHVGVVRAQPEPIPRGFVQVSRYGPAIHQKPESVGLTRVVGEAGDPEHMFSIRGAEGGAGVPERGWICGSYASRYDMSHNHPQPASPWYFPWTEMHACSFSESRSVPVKLTHNRSQRRIRPCIQQVNREERLRRKWHVERMPRCGSAHGIPFEEHPGHFGAAAARPALIFEEKRVHKVAGMGGVDVEECGALAGWVGDGQEALWRCHGFFWWGWSKRIVYLQKQNQRIMLDLWWSCI